MAFDQFTLGRSRTAEFLTAEAEAVLARAWRDHGDTAPLYRLIRA